MGDRPLKRAIFLDRDGVINEPIVRDGRPYPPATLAETIVSPGAPAALDALRRSAFDLLVVTNQPDVARGIASRDVVDGINAFLGRMLPIDAFYVCEHDDIDNCDCRKPRPGLLLRAAAERGIDLSRSYLIGDRWRDVAAGQAAGVTTVFIDRGYDERKPSPAADLTASDIITSAQWIVAREPQEHRDRIKERPPG